MPVKSKPQWKLMQAIVHGKAKGIGCLDKDTAKEFINKTPKRKRSLFSKGK